MLKFYEKILSAFDMRVEDGKIYVGDQVKKIGGLPLVMPTRENVAGMTTLGADNKYHQNVELFHPLRDVIDRDNPSLRELKRSMEIINNNYMYNLTILLVKLIETKPTDISLTLMQFLSTVVVSKQVKVIIDDKFIEFLTKNITSFLKGELRFIKTNIPRGIKVKGGKVNRALTLESPLQVALEDREKFKRDYHLDNKHVEVLKAIVGYLVGPWLKDNVITFSNHGSKAGPVVVLEGHLLLTEHLNKVGEELDDLDHERIEELHTNILYDMDELENLVDIDTFLPEIGKVEHKSAKTTALQDTYVPPPSYDQRFPEQPVDDNSKYISPEQFLQSRRASVSAQPGCIPQQGYIPQPGYVPQPNYGSPQPRYNPQPNYGSPQPGYVPQQPRVDYLGDLIKYGDKMSVNDREEFYRVLSPQEKEQYHTIMSRQQLNNRFGSPDRR